MFGYIRPYKDELKVREFTQFRWAYCGLCHSLKDQYGLSARFVLNYDLTFLEMLLSTEPEIQCTSRRCIVHPFKKHKCQACTPAASVAAGYSVVLTYWKMADTIRDEGFWKGLAARIGKLCLRRAYKKASQDYPDFDQVVQTQLAALQVLEHENSDSMDAVADCFAKILQACAAQVEDTTQRRVLETLLYHIGRIVYIYDAYDDLEEDVKKDRYNPLRRRFSPDGGCLPEADMSALRLTLNHSMNAIGSAFELLPNTPWTGIISNIVYLGIPAMGEAVLAGVWKSGKNRVPKL